MKNMLLCIYAYIFDILLTANG